MTRGPSKFRQRDLTRAAKGLAAAGLKIQRLDVDPAGRFTFTVNNGEKLTENEWEEFVREEIKRKAS